MEWLLANPQIHSIFASLGTMHDNSYVASENCLALLEEINYKLSIEDHTLRTFRRAIGFSQCIKKDIIPLLLNVKDEKLIEATIRILVNLTVPVECLLPMEMMSRTDVGRHTIFELNKLLVQSKEAFTDSKATKAVLDYMRSILEKEGKLGVEQCDGINNCLLLLRNILHIPEPAQAHHGGHHGGTSMQNQIVWNLFTQSVDKLLIHLMSCPQRAYWGVTMVQVIALMYKDQHVGTLQKLLNIWFESSISESSDDNESNTSPPKQCSGDSSPMLTSDPTSDSSDNGGSSKMNVHDERRNSGTTQETSESSMQESLQFCRMETMRSKTKPQNQSNTKQSHPKTTHTSTFNFSGTGEKQQAFGPQQGPSQKVGTSATSGTAQNTGGPSSQSESDCGYGTQDQHESISTSSNEDETPQQKPVHQKPPCNQKQRYNAANKQRNATTVQDKKELRRKKLVKRSRSNIINMKGLLYHTPTDEDISNILKEFTVDFLLKGYGCLVQELHAQLLTDLQVQIDTSHFFWLVTYFLRFAAQLELDLEHINSVLSFEIVSYLTYEGVSLCEQLELATKQQSPDLKPCLRRMHLVVTAIREFLQALDTYKKISHLNDEDKEHLRFLQLQIGATEDLKCLFMLLLGRFNPELQSKQYLTDLIVTNHILLLLLEGVAKFPEHKGSTKMLEHIKQFATVEIMHHYGLLLEDFRDNGECVNDCIFTMMHHIGGDLGQVATLFQPIILKTYTQIWETDYELCDDWSDLIEYVIHKFVNTPQQPPLELPNPAFSLEPGQNGETVAPSVWTKEEIDTLYWYYVQNKKSGDVIGNILKQFQDNGTRHKTRIDIIQQLLQQDIITLLEFDDFMKLEDAHYERDIKTPGASTSTAESGIELKDNLTPTNKPTDDIQVLRDRLYKENKGKFVLWLQKVLVECCFIKLCISQGKLTSKDIAVESDVKTMEPVPHHCILKKQSIPVVPWTGEQCAVLLYQPFMLLLHKLGFHLPVDAGKLFIRIPEFWTADILYSIAEKLGPIDKCLLKFDVNQLKGSQCGNHFNAKQDGLQGSSEHFAIPGLKQTSSIIRFTPEPTSTPSLPNWLQIVMQSKTTLDHSSEHDTPDHAGAPSPKTNGVSDNSEGGGIFEGSPEAPFDPPLLVNVVHLTNKEDCDSERPNDDFQSTVWNASVQAVEDVVSNCDTASVASDLTRMYVSDEDEKPDIRRSVL
ncbi:protein timeless isoform X2 [Phlebotomus papatasi]|uniref:protein timeless isoform X2 n=1 Tax=Phlebotomus papatasi TaxID=29031 RepID=UPI002483EA00|nr:protein timeless isoform X2 [Phlebotomus papatasi]